MNMLTDELFTLLFFIVSFYNYFLMCRIEQQVQQVEVEIQQCRRMADTLVEDMVSHTSMEYASHGFVVNICCC